MTTPLMAIAFVAAAAVGALPAAFAQDPIKDRGRAAPTVSSSQVIGAQAADEWLASQLRGAAVVGADGRRIGEVVDILLNRNGTVRAFVVGMGGVMGLGVKEIAIDLGQFHDIPAPGNGRRPELKVPLTMDQLAEVPEFKPLPAPDATTGAARPR
jgi:sporulation protein YlmC with PRC-barrel domain